MPCWSECRREGRGEKDTIDQQSPTRHPEKNGKIRSSTCTMNCRIAPWMFAFGPGCDAMVSRPFQCDWEGVRCAKTYRVSLLHLLLDLAAHCPFCWGVHERTHHSHRLCNFWQFIVSSRVNQVGRHCECMQRIEDGVTVHKTNMVLVVLRNLHNFQFVAIAQVTGKAGGPATNRGWCVCL